MPRKTIAKAKPTRLSIYDSPDFASFLTDYVKNRKRTERGYSFAVMSRSLGQKSPSLLVMVGRGERMPQPDLLLALCKYLGLKAKEVEYAQALVGFQWAKAGEEKMHFAQKLRVLKPINEAVIAQMDVLEALYHWYNAAIYVLPDLKDFKLDPDWISRRFGGAVSPAEVQQSIDLFLRLKMFVKDDAGKIKQAVPGFSTPDNIPRAAVRAFHRQMFQRAQAALEEQPIDQRYFIGTTMALEKSKLELASQMIGEFIDNSFKKEISSHAGDEIYHVAIQFFRVTDPVT